MSGKACKHDALAANNIGNITICHKCGMVHVNLQNLSLNFDARQFSEFSALVAQASNRMNAKTRNKTSLSLVH